MIDYIKGEIIRLNPTEAILECNGIGYRILISLNTFSALEGIEKTQIYIYHYLREDEELYYGFATTDERELFTLLLSVSGIGAATARMMLSSLTPDDIRGAILSEDVNRIKSVKGIGLKSAQRIIIELKDKIVKGKGASANELLGQPNNSNAEEATEALLTLGFAKANVNKVVTALLKEKPNASLEEIIKLSLKKL